MRTGARTGAAVLAVLILARTVIRAVVVLLGAAGLAVGGREEG